MIKYTQREIAVKTAWHFWGKFYTWGGDDPSGFDCSGLIMECLQSAGTVPRKGDMNAEQLYHKFSLKITNSPREGTLTFYKDKDGKITHVEIMIDTMRTMGASGGHRGIKTIEDAIKANAFIKVRPLNIHNNPIYIDPYTDEY